MAKFLICIGLILSQNILLGASLENHLFSRTHKSHSLFRLKNSSLGEFLLIHAKEYSLFKYGDKKISRKYALALAQQIQTVINFSDPSKEIVLMLPARYHLPTSAVLLGKEVARLLASYNHIEIPLYELSRSSTLAGDFSALESSESRLSAIDQHFYYEGLSLTGKTVIFIDDALVSGAHYMETQRVLKNADLNLDELFSFFIVQIDPSNPETEKLSSESRLNNYYVSSKHPERLKKILLEDDPITPRMLKLILSSPETTEYFATHLPSKLCIKVCKALDADRFQDKEIYQKPMKRLCGELQ